MITTTIINRTPHPITIFAQAGASEPILTLPAAAREDVARVECSHRVTANTPVGPEETLVPLVEQVWGDVTGLPARVGGVWHVVSAIVAAAAIASARGAEDLLVRGDQVRDGQGRIVGCRGLCRASSAMPHLASGAEVWMVYTVEDLRAWGVPSRYVYAASSVVASSPDPDTSIGLATLAGQDLAAWTIVVAVFRSHFGSVFQRFADPCEADLADVCEALLVRPHRRRVW